MTAVKRSSPKVHKSHAILRARETTKEKHKCSKTDLVEGPLASGLRKQAGFCLRPGPLGNTEETGLRQQTRTLLW